MKKFPKELKFFFAVFFVLTLLFSVSSKVLAVENSFDYISGINYEPIAKLVNFLNDKKRELEKLGDSFEKTNSVKNSARDNYGKNKTKNRFLLSVALEPAKDAIIGKPKKYIEKVFCVAKDFVFPGACKESVSQDYSGAITQENNKEELDALKKQYDDAIVSANELDQKFNLLQKELGKVKAGGVVIKEPIIEQKTVERTIEKIVSGVSQDDLSSSIASIKTELNNLNTNLANQINNLSSNTSRQSTAAFQAISLTNRIDNLSGTRLSGITVNGVSGLTNSDIPDDITASNYLPLTGGTISGDLTVTGNATLGVITLQNATAGYFTATSTSQASTFPYASTTALTVDGSSWFNGLSTMANLLLSGSTTLQNFTANNSTTTNATTTNLAVSSSAYFGNLNGPLQANSGLISATTSIGVQYGGTGQTSFGQGWLHSDGTTFTSSTSPTVNYFTATSTTATSTFAGGLSVAGTAGLTVLQNGNVGIGTTTPGQKLDVIGNGTFKASAMGDALILNPLTTGLGANIYVANVAGNAYAPLNMQASVFSLTQGNVGIGTTSPYAKLSVEGSSVLGNSALAGYFTATSTTATSTFAGGLSVAGHCVTGDTRLRRRRRKKNGSYEYDEVAIKDIQPGDEIASLDEETGKIVWSKVNALMDMGVKRIYKLTTVSGKTIRTTAEHPYLVKNKEMLPKKAIAFIDYANIKAWLRDKKLSIDLELLIKALVSAGINDVRFYYGSDSEKNSISDFFKKLRSFGYTIITKPIQYFKVSLSYLLKQKTNRMLLESISSAFEFSLEKEALRMDKENISLFAPKANFDVEISVDAIKKSKNIDVFVLFSGDGDFAYLLKELKLLGKKTVVVSGRKSLSGSLVKEADKFVTLERLSGNLPGLVRIDKNAKPARRQVLKNCASNIADLLGLSNYSVDNLATSENGLWKKVVYLKEGMEIAVNDAESDSAIFDKIAQIEILPEEQVYDIEVDGTHNFIGNDIVAHNTYIGGTASSTNLIVSNSSALGTVSSGLWNGSAISTQYGGTGQNFSASSGLINLYSGTASAMATSSLGLLTTDVAEGTNQYWTNTRFDNRLSATTTLPNLTTLLGLTNASTTGLTVSGQTTLATTLTGLLKGASGVVSAITTSLGLAGEISDETGSGALVFGTSPVFTTQITTPSIISSSALGITPASGSNLNVNLAGTGDFAVNTSQLYVDTSSGNVGIGTTTPGVRLDVAGGTLRVQDTGLASSGKGLELIYIPGTDNGYVQAYNRDTSAYKVLNLEGSNVLLNQNSGGNVGIGTTTPSKLLSINGGNGVYVDNLGRLGIGVEPNTLLNVSGTQASVIARLLVDDVTSYNSGNMLLGGRTVRIGNSNINSSYSSLEFMVGNSGFAAIGVATTSNPAVPDLVFGTGGTVAERMRINNAGNVGIGTTTPNTKLSVGDGLSSVGNYWVAGTYLNKGISIAGNSSGEAGALHFEGNRTTAASTAGALVFRNYQSSRTQEDKTIAYITASTPDTYDAEAGTLRFGTHDTTSGLATRMTIDESGNVGIGTTTPARTLSVNGTAGTFGQFISSGAGSGVGFYLGDAGADKWQAGLNLALASGGNTFEFRNLTGSGVESPFVIETTGNVGVGTTSPWRTLGVTGTVGFDGLTGSTGAGSLCLDANKQVVYNSASDACLSSTRATKHDIQNLNLDGLSLINQLQPSSFIYNQGDGRTRYGFMAEDTALADDRLATHNEKGEITGIDDRAILSVAVKAIKEMKVQLSDLQASVVASGGQTSDSLFSWIMGKFSAIGVVFGQDKLGAKKGVFERFEMKDADTGEDYCVKIRNGEWEKTKGTCGETSISSSSVSSPSSSGAVSSSSSSSAEASSSSSAESSLSSSSSETSSSSSSEASSSSSEASSLSSSSASSSESSSSTSSETGSSSSSSLNSDSSSSSVSSSSSSSAEANSSSSVGSSSSSSSSETSSSSSSEGSSSSVSLEAGSSSSVAS